MLMLLQRSWMLVAPLLMSAMAFCIASEHSSGRGGDSADAAAAAGAVVVPRASSPRPRRPGSLSIYRANRMREALPERFC